MLRTTLAVILLSLFATTLSAQVLPGLVGGSADAQASETADQGTTESGASTQALIDLLRDDAARQELIDQLEAAQEAQASDTAEGTPSTGSAAEEAPAEEEPQTLGRRISDVVTGMANKAIAIAGKTYRDLSRVPGRLDDIARAADPALIMQILSELAFVVATTYAAFFLFRVASRRASKRLSDAALNGGIWRRIWCNLASNILDASVVALSVLASVVAAALVFGSEDAGIGQVQVSYLSAFAAVELVKVAFRAVLAPRFQQLRLIPMDTGAARGIWKWLAVSITILGYGQFLLVPIVQREVGYLPAFALTSLLGAIVILYTLYKVIRHRRAVADWIVNDQGDKERSRLFVGLAEMWYVPVVLYLLGLLVIVLIRPGNVLLPLLWTSAKVVGLIVFGLLVRIWTRNMVKRGVRLSPALHATMPTLEKRLNNILPKAIIVLRIVLWVTIVFSIVDIIGLFDVSSWLVGDDGVGYASELITILAMLSVALMIWLAIASWIDYRLNPSGRRLPTSRETTLLTLLYNAMTIALVIMTTMFVLSEMGINIAPLLASAGVLGLAIGFGAQKLVQDIITGIFIQFENAINVGDVVTVGGTTGVVEKLTVRSVSMRDVHGVFHIVPFSSVDMVSNYMKDFSMYVIDMGIAYREDLDDAKLAMHDAFATLKESEDGKDILGDLEWMGLNEFGDSAVVLRARIKTIPGKQWGIGRAYNAILWKVFDERSIEIPFPHMTVYFGEDRDGSAPPVHILQERAVKSKEEGRKSETRISNAPDDEEPGDDD